MMSMGPPPMLPGYSLRVQLFAPNAHAASDDPVRCFRVVTSPDATLHEFCEEATRIHAINYGQSISIKKCQDDQLFDVTQSDLIGSIFPNASTIRMIQASNVPSIRDSVPPTSALSYDPANILGKRQRLESPILNGPGPPNSWKVNKKQRLFDIDPDEPIQSREQDSTMNRNMQEDDVVPDSQENGSLFVAHGYPERQSSAFPSLHSPYPEPLTRPSANGSRAKSATYHIPRLEERELPPRNLSKDSPHSGAQSGKNENRSGNEDSIYDDIASDQESIPGLWRTRATLKIRNNSRSSLPGPSQGNKLDTPSTGTRRHSSKLPLTPSSKTKKAVGTGEGQNNQASTRSAAAKAAEQRHQAVESRRIQEQEQAARELKLEEDEVERERLGMKKADETRAKELAAAAVKAEQIRKEQEERKAAVAMEKKLEAKRLHKERAEKEAAATREKFVKAERLEKEKREEQAARERGLALERRAAAIVQKKLNEKKAKEELAAVAKAEKLRVHLEKENKQVAAAAEKREALESKLSRTKAAALSKKKSSSPGTEALDPKLAMIKPQSATPFIPRGRSASRQSSIRSALKSSSPEFSRASPQVQRKGVGLADQCPLPIEKTKSVAFINDTDNSPKPLPSSTISSKFSSPILPGTKVSVTLKPAPARMTSQISKTPILPPKLVRPMLPPGRMSTPQPATSSQVSFQPMSVTPVPPPSSLRIARSVDEPRKERESIPVVEIPIFTPPQRLAKRVTAEVPTETAFSQQRSSPSPAHPARKRAAPTASMGGTMARPLRASQSGIINTATNTNTESLERSTPFERQSVKTEIVNSLDEEIDSSDDGSEDFHEGNKTNEEYHVQKPALNELLGTKSTAEIVASVKVVQPEIDSPMQADVNFEKEDHVDDDFIQAQDEDDEDGETTSRHSSPRESRSPVVFNRYMNQELIMTSRPPRPAQAARAPSTNSIASNNDVTVETVYFEEGDQEEEEEAKKSTEESKEGGDESESESLSSKAENVGEDRASPDFPSHNSRGQAILSPPLCSQRSQPLSPSRAQDEIDQRLSSDIHETNTTRTPSQSQPKRSPPPILSGSAIRPTQKLHPRPAMRNGVSLSAMKSGIVGSYRSQVTMPYMDRTRNAAAAMARLQEQEYLSENEFSYSDSDSSKSDNDEVISIATPKSIQAKTKAGSDDSDDSDNEHNRALDLTAQRPSAGSFQRTMNQRERVASRSQRKRLVSKKAGEDMRGKTTDRVISGYSFARPP